MEKTSPQKLAEMRNNNNNHVIWDCGSSLYDSYELRAFEKQLDSAIASRTLSMPHLSNHHWRRTSTITITPQKKKMKMKPMSKILGSFQRFTRAIFRPKLRRNDAIVGGQIGYNNSSKLDGFNYNDNSSEFDGLSPDLAVRKTASERFTFTASASLGISPISPPPSCLFI